MTLLHGVSYLVIYLQSWNSSVSIVTRLRAGRP